MRGTLVFDTLGLIEKRMSLLLGARWQDKGQIMEAIHEQDKIRASLSKRLKGKDSVSIIREMRDNRCKY